MKDLRQSFATNRALRILTRRPGESATRERAMRPPEPHSRPSRLQARALFWCSLEIHPRKSVELAKRGLVVGQLALVFELKVQHIHESEQQCLKVLPVCLISSQGCLESGLRLRNQTFCVDLQLFGGSLRHHILVLDFCHAPLYFCLKLLVGLLTARFGLRQSGFTAAAVR